MSVLRMLSPTRGASSPSSPSHGLTNRKQSSVSSSISVNLRVPSYGTIPMPFPDPLAGVNSDTPRTDKELHGDLEIAVPQGVGRIRCKAIRIGVRTSCRLDIPRSNPSVPGKMVRQCEEDTLWTGKVEVRGGTADGVLLEEGLQRFTFTIIIPGNLAPHDYHPGHRVDNILFAEVEGVEEQGGGFGSWFRRSSSTSTSPASSRATSPTRYPMGQGSPVGFGSGGSSPRSSRSGSPLPQLMTPPQSLSILRQEVLLPQPPSYDLSEGNEEETAVPWLIGTHCAERTLILIYNPDPAGGVSSLDTRIDTAAAGLGPVSVAYVSDEWTIAAYLKSKLTLPALSPAATVFHVKGSLIQNTVITSPRDGAKAQIDKEFTIVSYGPGMPQERNPGTNVDAIWRGKDAGGEDENELALDGQGRLPNDYEGRPTTLEGVETPIRVSHQLRMEVFFSVWGEDVQGNPIDGPGELRVLRVDKNVILPACFLIPEVLNLPIYEANDDCPLWTIAGKICPLCSTPSTQQFCQTCPPTAIPHPRHDHPPKLVGNPSGICEMCCQRVLPTRGVEWRDCACGLLREDIIERMKRVSLGDRAEEEMETEEVRGRRRREEKVEAERGRA